MASAFDGGGGGGPLGAAGCSAGRVWLAGAAAPSAGVGGEYDDEEDRVLEALLALEPLPRSCPERLVAASLDAKIEPALTAVERMELEEALAEAGGQVELALADERARLDAAAALEAGELRTTLGLAACWADVPGEGGVWARNWLGRTPGIAAHPAARPGADVEAIVRRHRCAAVVQAVLVAAREAPAIRGGEALVRGDGGLDASASDAVAVLAARGVDVGEPVGLVGRASVGELPRRRVPLSEMLATAAEAVASATPRVTASDWSAALKIETARASETPTQAAQGRVAASGAADCFAHKAEAESRAERQRARGSLLRRLRRAAGGRPGLLEVELYRVFDVGSSEYFHKQTAGVRLGHLVFVRQGKHGAISMVIVGGRAQAGGAELEAGGGGAAAEEFTFLIRMC